MIELTDINLDSFILREIKGVVSNHPRFKNLGGETSSYYSTLMRYNDLEIVVKNPTADGTRLNPDHFMCTMLGRVILAKVGDKAGEFIEFIEEVDKTSTTPLPGLYYLAVTSVNEETREVGLIQQLDKWYNGATGPANGSLIYYNQNRFTFSNLSVTNLSSTQYSIATGYITLFQYATAVTIVDSSSNYTLQPNLDYWLQRYESNVIVQFTIGGRQAITLTDLNYLDVNLVDQDGYTLRRDVDYYFSTIDEIVLSEWTAPNQTISMVGYWRRDPSTNPLVSDENILKIPLQSGEQLISNQLKISTDLGDFGVSDTITAANGKIYLLNLLQPGQNLKWQARVTNPSLETSLTAYKNSISLNLIPGLNIAIGDKVTVGDQIAIMVNPSITETYEVYGSKEGISFDIDIKTNDMVTSSELGQLIKRYFLVEGRERLEACGFTVYEISRSTQADQKDASGLTSSQHVMLSVRGSADWELRKPLINYVGSYDLTGVNALLEYPGKLSFPAIATTYGSNQFLTYYS